MKPIATTTVVFSVLLTGLVVLALCRTADSGTIFRSANVQTADGCCQGKRGNVDGTGIVDLVDLSSLVNYLTVGSYIPACMDEANINGVGIVDLVDLSSLVNYLTTGVYVLPDCPASTVTDVDGNEYKTVKIGTQVWMAENLKVTHYRNGDTIPNVVNGGTWAGLGTGAYCDYANDTTYVATYGRLYNWFAASDSRNIAPAGWHVPTDSEFRVLEMSLGMSEATADSIWWRGSKEGDKLKETGTAHWAGSNAGATNISGFTALPAGFRGYDGDFNSSLRTDAYFWATTEFVSYDNSSAYGRWLSYGYAQINRSGFVKQNGFSIRCVKDDAPATVTDVDGNVYSTVTIGNQVWMAENLRATHYRNGDTIPEVTDSTEWIGLTTGARCTYNNAGTEEAIGTYGRLYNWFAAHDSRGLAPVGWHVASDSEWQTMVNFLGGDVVTGGKLKEAGTLRWLSPNTGATNMSGFAALPGGFRNLSSVFRGLGYDAYFWSTAEFDTDRAWGRSVSNYSAAVYHYYDGKVLGLSVRCIKD
jgi:uncharacterized protein (TIGR02145 family)